MLFGIWHRNKVSARVLLQPSKARSFEWKLFSNWSNWHRDDYSVANKFQFFIISFRDQQRRTTTRRRVKRKTKKQNLCDQLKMSVEWLFLLLFFLHFTARLETLSEGDQIWQKKISKRDGKKLATAVVCLITDCLVFLISIPFQFKYFSWRVALFLRPTHRCRRRTNNCSPPYNDEREENARL